MTLIVLLLIGIVVGALLASKDKKPTLTPEVAQMAMDGIAVKLALRVNTIMKPIMATLEGAVVLEPHFEDAASYFEAKKQMHRALTHWVNLSERCTQPEVTGALIQRADNEARDATATYMDQLRAQLKKLDERPNTSPELEAAYALSLERMRASEKAA